MPKYLVDNKYSGYRIDKYLSEIANKTRSFIQNNLISLKVNDKEVKLSYKVLLNDIVEVIFKEEEKIDLEAKNLNLDIIYEDSDLAVINKPKGLVVHPAPGHYNDTLVSGLMYQIKDLSSINGSIRPGIVHRLDKDTSGLLVIAKGDLAHQELAKQLKNHTMYREYHALTIGLINEDKGKIIAPIGRNKQERTKMAVVSDGKEAITHFEVIERFKNNTYIKCLLESGRTHQIRVHLAYINKPILGDPLYGPRKVYNTIGQYLHAKKITFIHPRTKEVMTFEVDLPDYFKDELNRLKNEGI